MTRLYKLHRLLAAALLFGAIAFAQVQIKVAPASPIVTTLVGVDVPAGLSLRQAQLNNQVGADQVASDAVDVVGWNFPAPATNVTISAYITSGTAITAYLTTQIGAGTTVSNQIATTTLTGSSDTTGQATAIFTGLNFAAGNYYLTLTSTAASTGINVPFLYAVSTAPGPNITNAAGGVTGLFEGLATGASVAAYPPASTFTSETSNQQTGTPFWNAYLFDIVSVQNSVLPAATVGNTYTAAVTATGGVGSYTWSAQLVTGAPLTTIGLTLNPSTGIISGTPTTSGTFGISFTATDIQSNSGAQGMTLPVNISGKVLTANLPANLAIVNLNGQIDLANHANASLTWKTPFSNAGQLVKYTLSPGTYTFRVIDPADATAIFPNLTAGQTSSMWTAWTYNIPWITGWLAFDNSATANTNETQLFSGADAGPGLANAAAAYADAITNGYENSLYPLIRTATPQKTWYFPNTTTLIFALPDDQGQDNGGGVSILIAPAAAQALNITTSSLPGGQVGLASTPFNLAATGGFGNYSWSATGLPPGMTLANTGQLTGTPTHTGTYFVTLTVEDLVSGLTFTLPASLQMTIAPPSSLPSITTTSLPEGEASAAYSTTVAATGGFGAYTWSISQGTPPLAINAATGVLSSSGPLPAGNIAQFTVMVTDAAGDTNSQNFTVTVATAISIPATTVPFASMNETYGFQLSALNGTGGNSWTVSAGSLPAGLLLQANGLLVGKPSVAGSFNFTAQVTDSANGSASRAFSFTVTPSVSYVVANRAGSLAIEAGDGSNLSVLSAAGGGYDVAEDGSGNFIVAAVNSILRVTPSGATTTIATTTTASWIGVTVDGTGNIIAADNTNHELWRISPDGATQTVIGQYVIQPTNNAEDVKVVLDSSGNYIVAHDNTVPAHIVKVTPSGVVTEVPLSGLSPRGVGGLALDATGNYMFLDSIQNNIYQITPSGTVSLFASGVGTGNQPLGLARIPTTEEYFVGLANGSLVKVSANGQTVSPFPSNANVLTHPEGVVVAPFDYPASVDATDPLGYFRFEISAGPSDTNNYAFAMQTGATVTAPAVPGAPIGNPANNYASFDGTNTAQITTNLTGGIGAAGSMAAWVNFAALPSASGQAFRYIAGESQIGNDFDLQFSNDNVLRFYTTNNGSNISFTPDPTTLVGQWHMIAVTFDNNAGKRAIYWDGALVASDNVLSTPNKTTAFHIGSSSPTFTGRNFLGAIDEAAIWNYALSPAQVYRMFITRGGASGTPISSISPTSAPVNSGATNVTITSLAIANGATVLWTAPNGQATVLPASSNTGTQITVSVPATLLTTAGTAEVSVVDAGVPTNQLPFSVTTAGAPLSISPQSIPDLTVGVPYTQTLTGSGGSGNYSWAITSQDSGVNLTITPNAGTATATLHGTPTTAYTDTTTIAIKLTDTTTSATTTLGYFPNVNPAPPPPASPEPSGITAWVIDENGALVAVTNNAGTRVGPATGCLACFDMARDAAGNFIIAAGDRIRRYTPNGGPAGADILAPEGSFYESVSVDGAGNYVVTDIALHEVVRIAASAVSGANATVVYTYPGSDEADAYVRIDSSGNYILAENDGPNGVGSALSLFRISPDGSQHTAIPLQPALSGGPVPVSIGGMTFDAQGNYVVVDPGRVPQVIFTITPTGTVSALFTDSNSVLSDAEGISRDPISGDFLFVDDVTNTLYMMSANGGNLTTLLSGGVLAAPGSVIIVNNVPPGSVDYTLQSNGAIVPLGGGTQVSCSVSVCSSQANDFAVDAAGNFIVASNTALAKVTQANVSSSIAAVPTIAAWRSVAVDSTGNYIVADDVQHKLLKVTPGGTISSIASWPVTNASNNEDVAVRIDASGNYVVAENNSPSVRIFRITPAGVVTEIALSGAIPATVGGLAINAAGSYIVTDFNAAQLYVITPSPTQPTGVGAALPVPPRILSQPLGIFVDPTGRYLVADDVSGTVDSVSADGSQIVPIVSGLNLPVAVLSLSSAPLTITTLALPAGTQGQGYSFGPLAATGASGTYQWSATGLPAGLSMSLAGIITGTPTQAGTFSVVAIATDASNSNLTATKTYQLAIGSPAPPPPPALTISSSTSSIQTKAGGAAAASFSASGGTPPYSFSASGLPAGVSLGGSALSGSPSQAGTFNVLVTVTDSQHIPAQTSLTIYVLGLTTTSLPGGTAGQSYSAPIGATGGSAGYSFTASGLPPGLSLSTDGTVSGTPNTAGTYSTNVTVASAGVSVSGSFSVTIAKPQPLSVSSTTLPDGTINIPYSQPLAARGGLSPYTWTLISGSLPAGLSMNGAGVMSGTPTTPGTVSFGAQVTDSAGATATGTVTLKIQPAPLTITTQSLPSGMSAVDYPVQLLAATGGVSPYTWSAGSGNNLPGGMTFSSGGSLSGTPAAAGSYTLAATVTDAAGTKVTASLGLTIRPQSADLILTAGSLQFPVNAPASTVPGGQTVGVQSTVASQQIAYSYAVNPAVPWLNVTGGSSTPDTLQVSITSAALSLGAGDYQTTITATCTSNTCTGHKQSVAVDLTITTAPPKLLIGTTLLSFATTTAASGPLGQSINVKNAGGGTIGFASVACEDTWCTAGSPPANLTGGASATIQIAVDPSAVSPGFHRTQVDIVSSAGRGSVPVTLFLAPSSTMTLAPAGQQFNMPAGSSPGNPNGSFLVVVNNPTPANWTAAVLPGTPWLVLGTPNGSSSSAQPQTVAFSIDPTAAAALAPGAYYGRIRITSSDVSNSPEDFEVILNVVPATAPLVPDPEPGGLLFITSVGGTLPPQTVNVYSGSTAPLTFQTSAATSDSGNWLSVSPGTGSASAGSPGVTTVTVNPGSLKAGIYHGGVSFSLSATAVRTVSVTLILTSAPAATASSTSAVTSNFTPKAAGCVASKLAPAQTGLVNSFSQPAAWPTPVVIQLSNDCGGVVTNGQVVATFSNGDPPLAMPLVDPNKGLYSGTWSPRTTGSQIAINVRASAPGLPDAISQISGAVTPNAAPVLTPHSTLHSFDPLVGAALAPGTIVAIYGQNLASQTAQPTSIPLPTDLNGTEVIVGGLQAPLYYSSAGQVNAQIPFELQPGQQYQVILSANGALTTPDTIQLTPATPGLAAFADGTLIAQHGDGTLVSKDSPAKAGEYLVAYAAGLGGTNATPASGAASPASPLASPTDPPTLLINAAPSPLLFAGLTPGLVGLYQVNFQVPADLAAGNITIAVTQDGLSSNETVLPYTP